MMRVFTAIHEIFDEDFVGHKKNRKQWPVPGERRQGMPESLQLMILRIFGEETRIIQKNPNTLNL